MREGRPSASAMAVAMARAQLTRLGVVEDPLAEPMLRPAHRLAVIALQRRPLTRFGRSPTLAFLAARTLAFDDAVERAMDAGIRQVVVVGAGYDSRAWRLAREGVQFWEVDHPATQADKRRRAPSGGPVYVPVDLRDGSIGAALGQHGFDASDRTVFAVEGVTMYLDEPEVRSLLADLAGVAAPGSRLAVNFTERGGGSVAPASRSIAAAIRWTWRLRGEPTTGWVRPDRLADLVEAAGWTVDEQLPGPALAERHLWGASLATAGVSPGAIFLLARRAGDP